VPSVEQVWHTEDSQGQFLAMPLSESHSSLSKITLIAQKRQRGLHIQDSEGWILAWDFREKSSNSLKLFHLAFEAERELSVTCKTGKVKF